MSQRNKFYNKLVEDTKSLLKKEFKINAKIKKHLVDFLVGVTSENAFDEYVEFIEDALRNGCKGYNDYTMDELCKEYVDYIISDSPTKENYQELLNEMKDAISGEVSYFDEERDDD